MAYNFYYLLFISIYNSFYIKLYKTISKYIYKYHNNNIKDRNNLSTCFAGERGELFEASEAVALQVNDPK